ncbi:MAG: chemotaxis protein CheC [Anaerolineaceae bacterium]|nr:chemotaxis protein CheC [Anaerolineaceae bacterium]
MMEQTSDFDQNLFDIMQTIASAGIHNAAVGFSSLLGHSLSVSQPSVKIIPLLDIPKIVGGLENEAIGIYLRAEGDMSAQIMLIIPYQSALELVDLLLGVEPGCTTQLGQMERSALAEVGNMTGTFFLNAIAAATGTSIRPSPPAVMVDMIGAILDIIIATSGGISDQVMLLEARFYDGDRAVETSFWVIPDGTTIKAFGTPKASSDKDDR